MKNYGFEVEINGEIQTRAGFDNQFYVLTAIFTSLKRKLDNSEALDLKIGGLNSDTDQHMDWLSRDLVLGDEIRLRVIDSNFDKPLSVRKLDMKQIVLENKIRHYYALKEELKDHLGFAE